MADNVPPAVAFFSSRRQAASLNIKTWDKSRTWRRGSQRLNRFRIGGPFRTGATLGTPTLFCRNAWPVQRREEIVDLTGPVTPSIQRNVDHCLMIASTNRCRFRRPAVGRPSGGFRASTAAASKLPVANRRP